MPPETCRVDLLRNKTSLHIVTSVGYSIEYYDAWNNKYQLQLHSWLQMQRLNLSYECCIFHYHIFKEIQWKVSVLKIDCQGKISEDFLGILLLVATGTIHMMTTE